METKTCKIRTCMLGFKKWMDDHPRKNLRGYFTVDGRDMTNEEVRRVVSYAVEKGYETEANISSEELNQLLQKGDTK